MIRLIHITLAILLTCTSAYAQKTPSWSKKASKAVCTIITYGKDKTLKNKTQGVFIDNEGTCITDYKTLQDADSAVVMTKDGKTYPLKYVVGADDIYDVAKIKALVKKSDKVDMAQATANVGDKVYVMMFSNSKTTPFITGTITETSPAKDGEYYYNIDIQDNEAARSCPVMNENGELIGLYQKSNEKGKAYICGARIADNLKFDAFMFQNYIVNSIKLLKKLPDNENDAQIAIMMGSANMNAKEYVSYLSLYMELFPKSPYSYEQFANYYADKDINKSTDFIRGASNLYEKEDERHFCIAKYIVNHYSLLKDVKGFGLDKAYEEIQTAISENPLPLYYQIKGDIEKENKQYTAALQSYSKVLNSNLRSASTIVNYMDTKELMGASPSEQVQVLDSIYNANKDSIGQDTIPLLYTKAIYLDKNGQYNEALKCLYKYSAAYNDKMTDEFFYVREQIAIKAKRYQQAMNDIEKALAINPDNITYKIEHAGLCILDNRFEQALNILQECHRMDSENPDINRLLGLSLLQLNRKDEACPYLLKAKEAGDHIAERLVEQYCNQAN